jgi:hypothetical protein
MHASIRHDLGSGWTVEETVRAGRALTAALGRVPGFISCALVETGDGGLTSICICEDQTGLEEARTLLADWLATALVPADGSPPRVITGEVIVQKGL